MKLVITFDQIEVDVRPSKFVANQFDIWDQHGLCLMTLEREALATRRTALEVARFYDFDELISDGGEVVE